MKYYVSKDGELFAYEEDGSQDAFIRADLTPINDEELAAIRKQQEADAAPTAEQLKEVAVAKRDELLTLAGIRIAPLQDAVDLDEATADEVSSLKQWKQFRVAVNRVTAQEGFPLSIEWPTLPGV